MTPNIFNCEDEQIHLCGRIQNFGYLIVFDLSYNCIAASENICDLFFEKATSVLNKKISFFENIMSFKINTDFNHLKENEYNNKFDYYKIIRNNRTYQLSVYIQDEHIIFEIEENGDDNIDLLNLQYININIENSLNIWQSVCDNFLDILGFDRIMVYQFLEDATGMVVAESINGKLAPVLGFRYPEFDIPTQARNLYLKNLDRQIPNIYADPIQIIGINPLSIDLSKSKIRALSPIHLQYLENAEVTASASFSIVIEGKLWGLVCCQHQSQNYVSISQRKLCNYIITLASNKFYKNNKILKSSQQQFIDDVERELKDKLFYSENIYNTLSQFVNRFMYILSAKGAILVSANTIFKCGKVPSDDVFNYIKEDLNQKFKKKNVYATYSYSNTKRNKLLDTETCSGIARINFDTEGKHCIYFFKPEIIKDEIWAGAPEKFLNFSIESKRLEYSPRTSFVAWKNEVKGESNKWSNFDYTFLETLHSIITDTIIRKEKEKLKLDEELALINRSNLDDFFMLDQKMIESLEEIRESSFYKKSIMGLSESEVFEHSNTILETTILTQHVISKTIDLALDNANNKHYNFIKIENFIGEIVNDALDVFKIKRSKIRIGDLLPVKGDKTLLHELFLNLIFNAVKFSSKKELAHIEIYSTKNKNEVTYYIQDNGIGLNTNDQDLPFVIFKKLSNAAGYEGDGVGLATVKRIVKRLNAEISFKSEVGVGTTFMIIFSNE